MRGLPGIWLCQGYIKINTLQHVPRKRIWHAYLVSSTFYFIFMWWLVGLGSCSHFRFELALVWSGMRRVLSEWFARHLVVPGMKEKMWQYSLEKNMTYSQWHTVSNTFYFIFMWWLVRVPQAFWNGIGMVRDADCSKWAVWKASGHVRDSKKAIIATVCNSFQEQYMTYIPSTI